MNFPAPTKPTLAGPVYEPHTTHVTRPHPTKPGETVTDPPQTHSTAQDAHGVAKQISTRLNHRVEIRNADGTVDVYEGGETLEARAQRQYC